MNLCQCDCGKEVTHEKNKFLNGHNCRGIKRDASVDLKRKQTCLKKYGVKSVTQLKEIKEKSKQTCIKKYGYEYTSQSKEIKLKKIQTNIKHWGFPSSNQSEKIKLKKKQTCLKNYGVENPFQSKEIQEQIKLTNIEKFGVPNSSQSEEIKEKIKQIHLEKRGVENPMQSEEVKLKKIKTSIKNWGVDHWVKTPQGKQSSRINCIRMIENQKLNGEPLNVKIGDIERIFLNELQKYSVYNIIRNDSSFRYIVGRYPDGHIPELKLFIQFDERQHFENKKMTIYKQDDIDCTLQLASLGYIIFRVSQRSWEENPEQIINQFKQLQEINNA